MYSFLTFPLDNSSLFSITRGCRAKSNESHWLSNGAAYMILSRAFLFMFLVTVFLYL